MEEEAHSKAVGCKGIVVAAVMVALGLRRRRKAYCPEYRNSALKGKIHSKVLEIVALE